MLERRESGILYPAADDEWLKFFLMLAFMISWCSLLFYITRSSLRICTYPCTFVCVCSQQLLPVVLMGTSQHAVSTLCFMLDLLEEVWRAQDAHKTGWREARTQPQQPGTSWHSEHTHACSETLASLQSTHNTLPIWEWGLFSNCMSASTSNTHIHLSLVNTLRES